MTSELKKLAREEFEKLRIPPADTSCDLAWYWWKKAFEAAWERFNNDYTVYPKPTEWTAEQWEQAAKEGKLVFTAYPWPPKADEDSNIKTVD